jgi:hypothetical protein
VQVLNTRGINSNVVKPSAIYLVFYKSNACIGHTFYFELLSASEHFPAELQGCCVWLVAQALQGPAGTGQQDEARVHVMAMGRRRRRPDRCLHR